MADTIWFITSPRRLTVMAHRLVQTPIEGKDNKVSGTSLCRDYTTLFEPAQPEDQKCRKCEVLGNKKP